MIWAITDAGVFWPVFPMVGWGIGLAMNAWDVYVTSGISEEDADRRDRPDAHRDERHV